MTILRNVLPSLALALGLLGAFTHAHAGEEQLRTHAQQDGFAKYQKGAKDRAFALSGSGGYGWVANRRSEQFAKDDAMKECKARLKPGQEPCVLVNVNGAWTGATVAKAAAPAAAAKPAADPLGSVWHTTENGWKGVWTRRAKTQVFDAVWTKDTRRAAAVMEFTVMAGNQITIQRKDTSSAVEFVYTGTINKTSAKGVAHIKGQPGKTYAWSATIG